MSIYIKRDSTKLDLEDPMILDQKGNKKIAVAVLTNINGKKIYLYDRGNIVRLTNDEVNQYGNAYVAPDGSIIFRSSTVLPEEFFVKYHIKSIDIFCVGGGGGANNSGAGGGGGYTSTVKIVAIDQKNPLIINIGAGGVGSISSDGAVERAATNGKASSVVLNNKTIALSNGGYAGPWAVNYSGGSGGSGGGTGSYYYNKNGAKGIRPSNGGSNGSNGYGTSWWSGDPSLYYGQGGTGQGKTTKFFSEDDGTLYAGGGGGGGDKVGWSGGIGGNGGGGNGEYKQQTTSNPIRNTGGGVNTGGGSGGGHQSGLFNITGGSGVVSLRCYRTKRRK